MTALIRRTRRFSPRARELWLLSIAVLAVAAAWATTWIAQSHVVEARSLAWAAAFMALMFSAHVGVRVFASKADPFLLPAVAVLCGIGITMIARLDPDNARRQTAWLVIGVVAMVSVLWRLRDHHVLSEYRYVIAAVSVGALLLTVSPVGNEVNGAQLWLKLGPINIQPGEFAKLGIVIFLAAYLRDTRELLGRSVSLRHLGPLLMFWGAALGLLVLMNDFGTSLLFYGTFLLLTYVATGRALYSAIGLGAFIGGSALVYTAVSHVQERFDIWLDPWAQAQSSGYQIIQGLFAMADGGLFGRGLGKAYLVTEQGNTLIPFAHTDFIFAAIGDELGFVGAIALLLTFMVVAWRGFAIAARARDGFSSLLAFGLATTFALQTIIIVGGVVRLLPLTGQTLPFVSYGGSSILANFILIALLLRISDRTQRDIEAAR
jgi:cell division protein FtsW (lipid II flippase)